MIHEFLTEVFVSDITQILDAAANGDKEAASQLLPLVYDELRVLAARKLADESPGQTLQATALVHEAYLRLVGDDEMKWQNHGHFFAAAAKAMRRILVDNARRKHRIKRGGGLQRHDISAIDAEASSQNLVAIDEALEKLASKDPEKAELVKLRFFLGLTNPEAAQALGISTSTADRYWAYARAWLFREMGGSTETEKSF